MYLLMSVIGPVLLALGLFWVSTHNRRARSPEDVERARPPVASRTVLIGLLIVLGAVIAAVGINGVNHP